MSEQYSVTFTSQAKKDIKSHRGHAGRILSELSKLESNPELGHLLRGQLHGARSLKFTLKGSGAFRAVYLVVPNEKVCLVFIVGPHENIYDRAARRAATLSGEWPTTPPQAPDPDG